MLHYWSQLITMSCFTQMNMFHSDLETFQRRTTKQAYYLTFPIHITLHYADSVSKYPKVRGHVSADSDPGPGEKSQHDAVEWLMLQWCLKVTIPQEKTTNITLTAEPCWPKCRHDENLKVNIFLVTLKGIVCKTYSLNIFLVTFS